MPNLTETEFLRVPGLYRSFELEQVIEPGHEYLIASHGECPPDSTPLYTVHQRRAVPCPRGCGASLLLSEREAHVCETRGTT